MRYLGRLCIQSKVPYIQDLMKIEMIARSVKCLMRDKIAKAVERYKSIEATNIEHDLRGVVLKLVNTTLCQPQKIHVMIYDLVNLKFGYELTLQDLSNSHKASLLLAIKHHCGIVMRLSVSNFSLPLDRHQIIGFEAKTTVPQFSIQMPTSQSALERHGYALARHLLYLGNSKFEGNESTSMKLVHLAQSYSDAKMPSAAEFLCKLAYKLAPAYHPARNIIESSYIEIAAFKSQTQVFELFDTAYTGVSFHLGETHPIIMTLYDKMVLKMSELNLANEALEILQTSATLSVRTLGASHPTSAGYKTKIGYMLMTSHNYKEALLVFKEAITLFKCMPHKSTQIREAISENHYCMAECYYECGSLEEALASSLEAKGIRDSIYGVMHPKTIDSFQQYARLLCATFADYQSILTDVMRKNLFTAITCYEKVFRFMKNNNAGTMLLLDLTRTLVGLKLRSLTGEMTELVRSLKGKCVVYEESLMREIIVKVVHLTPTVYLEEVFQRIGDGDDDAMRELGAVLQLIETGDKISTKK